MLSSQRAAGGESGRATRTSQRRVEIEEESVRPSKDSGRNRMQDGSSQKLKQIADEKTSKQNEDKAAQSRIKSALAKGIKTLYEGRRKSKLTDAHYFQFPNTDQEEEAGRNEGMKKQDSSIRLLKDAPEKIEGEHLA